MKHFLSLFTVVLCFYALPLYAQISAGGQPFSLLLPSMQKTAPAPVVMPRFDVALLQAEDAINDALKDRPYRFGYEFETQLSAENDGLWTLLPNGDKIWRLSIKSTGANSINLIFSKYKLPKGGQLFIYNTDRSHTIGAFTEANNQSTNQLGTTLVHGDQITVEYYQPSWADFDAQLTVGTVVHGYRWPGVGIKDLEKAFGGSGSCNINANCPSGAAWGDQKKSVGMLVSGGGFCTGALVNNTLNNGTPYFLTANHCFSSGFETWIVWFNWESADCNNPTSSPSNNSVSGTSLKARKADSDFCLLQLNETPPSSYGVYYAGWDKSGITPSSTTGIHHPSGDIKKIAFDLNPATNSSWSGSPANSHWHSIWDSGVTEPGSSGSPLFDQNKRIVGQLHGGASACGGSDLSDEYGKFSLSWNNSTLGSERLKDWLDPSSSNPNFIDGYKPLNLLSIAPSNQNVDTTAGTTTFAITTAAAWTATVSEPWATLSPSSGTGNGIITITYLANGSVSRSAVVSVALSNATATATATINQLGIAPVTCPVLAPITSCNTTFEDGSGSGSYQNGQNCSWLLQPSNGQFPTLTFNSFITESNYDFVKVYDGASTTAPVLGSFSGSSLPTILTATGNTMLVVFTTDGTVTYAGFSATMGCYTVEPPCEPQTLTACSGTIEESLPGNIYTNNRNCTWLIQPEGATAITLNFSVFDIELDFDSVYVYNGNTAASPLLGAFSGAALPPQLISGSSMFIVFRTDYSVVDTGWVASYTCTQPCTAPTNIVLVKQSATSVVVQCSASVGATKYQMQYRALGATAWITVNSFNPLITLSGLTSTTTYEYKMRTQCGTAFSAFAPTATFTIGAGGSCTTGPVVFDLNLSPTSQKVWVNFVAGAQSYQYRYAVVAPTTTWNVFNSVLPNRTLTGLLSGTNYKYQVRTKCNGIYSNFTSVKLFITPSVATSNGPGTTSLVMNEAHTTLLAYPNPAFKVLNLSSAITMAATVQVLDIHGATILEYRNWEISSPIDISSLLSGMYVVVVTDANNVQQTTRFIKMEQ